jgi:hypothetical protein
MVAHGIGQSGLFSAKAAVAAKDVEFAWLCHGAMSAQESRLWHVQFEPKPSKSTDG